MPKTMWVVLLLAVFSAIGCESGRGKGTENTSRSAPPESTDIERIEGRLRPVTMGHIINALEIEDLHRKGLRDPIPQLVDSLLAHPEVIPHPGVLGGTMAFYYPWKIHVLDDGWIYAVFDDGHIQGRGIFSYEVQPDSSLMFHAVYTVVD
jgi:hypothetical protein